jgi:hypothetical protein
MANGATILVGLVLVFGAYFVGYIVGQRFGYRRGHGDGWCDAVLFQVADEQARERLSRDVGEGKNVKG